jgi:hypothetical protein
MNERNRSVELIQPQGEGVNLPPEQLNQLVQAVTQAVVAQLAESPAPSPLPELPLPVEPSSATSPDSEFAAASIPIAWYGATADVDSPSQTESRSDCALPTESSVETIFPEALERSMESPFPVSDLVDSFPLRKDAPSAKFSPLTQRHLMATSDTRQLLKQVHSLQGQLDIWELREEKLKLQLTNYLNEIDQLNEQNRLLELLVQELPLLYRRKFHERLQPIKDRIAHIQSENLRLHLELDWLSQKLAENALPRDRPKRWTPQLPNIGRRIPLLTSSSGR